MSGSVVQDVEDKMPTVTFHCRECSTIATAFVPHDADNVAANCPRCGQEMVQFTANEEICDELAPSFAEPFRECRLPKCGATFGDGKIEVTCTLPAGHLGGGHVAHNADGKVIAVWRS